MTDWVVAKRGGEAKDRVGRNDRLSPVGDRKRVSRQEKDGKKRQEAVKRMSQGGRNKGLNDVNAGPFRLLSPTSVSPRPTSTA